MIEPKAAAVGHIPSGLFIVCAQDESTEKIDGYLASWIQQISFDPLLISLCVKPGRPAYDYIISGKVFTVNVVGEHNRNYLKHFWQGYDPAKNPFQEIPHRITNNGGVILDQAKSVIECKLHSHYKPGDHELVLAQVLAGYVLEDNARPYIHLRKSGLDY